MTSPVRPLKRSLFFVLLVLWAVPSAPSACFAQNNVSTEQQITAAQSTMENAIARVKAIVNQPVDHRRRTPEMRVAVFSPGWFHEGAAKPDFAVVDIRATQEFPYSNYTYVSSDLNPGEVFIGSQLEFNAMTKYFYVDRTVPKKRLDESEMKEINQLYRTVAQSTQRLEQLRQSEGLPFIHISEFSVGIILITIALALGALYFLWPLGRR